MVTDTPPRNSDAKDVCKWVYTDCMPADALTKQMSPEKLVAAVHTHTWSSERPIECEPQAEIYRRKRRSSKCKDS